MNQEEWENYLGISEETAVKQNGEALLYVKEQSPEICMEAAKQDGRDLIYVEEKERDENEQ